MIYFQIFTTFRYKSLKNSNDIKNVGNLINSEWGLAKSINSEAILSYNGEKYTFTAPQVSTFKGVDNTWQMLLSARLFF